MKTLILTTIALIFTLSVNAQGQFAPSAKPMAASVTNMDMTHFDGTWFEISRLPNAVDSDLQNVSISFETRDKMVKRNVTGYKENGRKVSVSGKLNYHGSGTFTGADGGVYMVLSADDDYQHILMGTPDHKYLWVMSRTPEMSTNTYNRLIAKANDLNYNVADVQLTSQK